MIDLGDIFPPSGAYPCRGCGATLERPGMCSPCGIARETREQNTALAAALASIPPRFRDLHGAELATRVVALRGKPAEDIAARVKALSSERVILIHGDPGVGKTSLACAALRAIIDAGAYPAKGIAFDTARRARFIAARSLSPRDRLEAQDPDAGVEASPRGAAARASVLLLDDAGQEGGDGYKASDRCKMIADILADRHDSGARTIVTSFANEAGWDAMYGAGVTRRYWDPSRVRVVRLS